MRLLLVVAAACAAALPAHAEDIDALKKVQISVTGTIRPHCAMGSVGSIDFGDLRRPGLGSRRQVAFDCNVPFTMKIEGQSGALAHTTLPGGQGPYAGAVPYAIAVEMPVRHPAKRVLSRTFDSRQLRSGGVISSNGGIATDGMALAVHW